MSSEFTKDILRISGRSLLQRSERISVVFDHYEVWIDRGCAADIIRCIVFVWLVVSQPYCLSHTGTLDLLIARPQHLSQRYKKLPSVSYCRKLSKDLWKPGRQNYLRMMHPRYINLKLSITINVFNNFFLALRPSRVTSKISLYRIYCTSGVTDREVADKMTDDI